MKKLILLLLIACGFSASAQKVMRVVGGEKGSPQTYWIDPDPNQNPNVCRIPSNNPGNSTLNRANEQQRRTAQQNRKTPPRSLKTAVNGYEFDLPSVVYGQFEQEQNEGSGSLFLNINAPKDVRSYFRIKFKDPAQVTTYTPVFVTKTQIGNVTLAVRSAEYDGNVKNVKLNGLPDDALTACRISFYSDEACTQPADLKNAGTYYVRVYRPEDETYKELDIKRDLVFKIAPAEITSEDVTFPTASNVIIGDKLSLSVLSGGSGVVPGTFAWEDPEQVVKNETNTFNVIFTPSDPNYKAKTVGVKVTGINTTKSGGETPPPVVVPVPVTGVTLDKTSLSLSLNETAQLTATIAPANADDKTVTWSSSNEAAVTVSNSGLVKAIAVGSAVITVTTNDGGKTAMCSVNSTPTGLDKIEGLKIYTEPGKILVNTTSPITVKVYDFVGKYVGGFENGIGHNEISVPKGAYILWTNLGKAKVIVF